MQRTDRGKVPFAGQAVCMKLACFLPACVGSLQVPPTFKDKHGSFDWLLLSGCGRERLFVALCDWYANKVRAGPGCSLSLARDPAPTLNPGRQVTDGEMTVVVNGREK